MAKELKQEAPTETKKQYSKEREAYSLRAHASLPLPNGSEQLTINHTKVPGIKMTFVPADQGVYCELKGQEWFWGKENFKIIQFK